MTRTLALGLLVALGVVPFSAQTTTTTPPKRLLERRYVDGQTLSYRMKGKNNNWLYEIRVIGTVRKNADGRFVDEFVWSDFVSDGTPRALRTETQALRAQVTLEGGNPFVMPNLADAGPIVGPVTDMLTFYADLFLAMHGGMLREAGDHILVPNPTVASWAAGLFSSVRTRSTSTSHSKTSTGHAASHTCSSSTFRQPLRKFVFLRNGCASPSLTHRTTGCRC